MRNANCGMWNKNQSFPGVKLNFVYIGFILIVSLCIYGFCEETIYPDLTLSGPIPLIDIGIELEQEESIIRINPRTVELLSAALREKDPSVRSQSAWALGEAGKYKLPELNNKIIAALITGLKDTDPRVRATSVAALAKIGGKDAVAGIINSLEDDDVSVKREAALALIELKPEEAVSSLIKALDGPDILVRKYAISALGSIGNAESFEPLKNILSSKDTSLKPEVLKSMAKINKKEALQYIVAALSDDYPPTRGDACLLLGSIGAVDKVDSILVALKDNHFYVRRSAAQSLGELNIKEDSVIQPLIPMLNDGDASVRIQACLTLTKLKAEPALQPLYAKLADEDKFVRRRAAQAIVDIGGNAIDILMSGINSKDIFIRRESAWGLGYAASLGAKITVEPLISSLKDNDILLRRNASWALGEIKDILSADALIESLLDADAEVRRNSAWALGEIDDNKAVPGLIKRFSDEETAVMAESARSLGKIADISSLEPLLGVIRNVKAGPSARRESAWALGELKDPKAIPTLVRDITEKTMPGMMGPVYDDVQVRYQAVIALGKIGGPAQGQGPDKGGLAGVVAPLEKCLTDEIEAPPFALKKALAELLTPLTGKTYTYPKEHYSEKSYFITPANNK
ncbi:MAG: HEAT repeat domain-containing protein [Candidatus Omnitrophica bacterium]|nr:HEAT repeat domain-containing protein [Candidatus Omnitrophota bacterium]